MADLIDRSVALEVINLVGDDYIQDTVDEDERFARQNVVWRLKRHMQEVSCASPEFFSPAYALFDAARNAGKRDAQETSTWELIDGAEPRRYGCKKCKCLSWYESAYCPNCGARMEDNNG